MRTLGECEPHLQRGNEYMASVQDKVAALNIVGKFYSPLNTPLDHRLINRTQDVQTNKVEKKEIWSHVIAALQAQVKVKKRRQHLRSHDNCFLGSNAVDVIQDYLTQNKVLGDAQVSRAMVSRLCQVLLDCKVFEVVGTKVLGKTSKPAGFQDSSSSLYRFLNMEDPCLDVLEMALFPPSEESLMNVTPCRQDILLFSHSTPVKPDHVLDRLMEKLDLTGLVGSPPTECLPPSVVREVWHEQTVRKLSQLIDLPLLEGVLNCAKIVSPPSRGSNSEPDLLYTSNYLEREVLKALKESQADVWLSAAIDVLDFLPDQLVVEVSRELPKFSCEEEDGQGMDECKLLLFHVLDKHYGHMERKPLLCDSMADVYTEIMELLMNGKFEQALEVLQLTLKLLSASAREELRRLLEFMATAADAANVQLHKEIENRMAVKKTFTRAIIQSKSLTKEKTDLLMLFMLDNHQEIFKIPGSLHKLVSEKLDDIMKHGDPSKTDTPFCQRVPRDMYTETIKDSTKNELYSLLKNIDENTKYSLKEKKRLLVQFYKGHPDIFMQYFGSRPSRLSTLNLLEV
ncbi:DEP domain-containing protein 7-like [Sinocyclocheilus anshuiensis]|uniref:DEP domain-containing protein 7 n=1 Tax=Sinocyclocheilus anshuiensis TaxID=1608454 RepID=A0A671KB54_9TELE|nr:PREDICTED: DEP domain-containing protein 7-like [Sinocyclocheilus anshuiensis]